MMAVNAVHVVTRSKSAASAQRQGPSTIEIEHTHIAMRVNMLRPLRSVVEMVRMLCLVGGQIASVDLDRLEIWSWAL